MGLEIWIGIRYLNRDMELSSHTSGFGIEFWKFGIGIPNADLWFEPTRVPGFEIFCPGSEPGSGFHFKIFRVPEPGPRRSLVITTHDPGFITTPPYNFLILFMGNFIYEPLPVAASMRGRAAVGGALYAGRAVWAGVWGGRVELCPEIVDGESVGRVVLLQFFVYHFFGDVDLLHLAVYHAQRVVVVPRVLLVDVHVSARSLLWKIGREMKKVFTGTKRE